MKLNGGAIAPAISDANSREEHDASPGTFHNRFGDVMDTDMIIAILERARSARAA